MGDEVAIKVDNLSKVYRLYDKPVDRLKESIHPLRKKYHKDFYALKNVSFEVKKGETVGIIGKNGSGKSTLLKIITGVLTPTSGNVVVNGKVSALLELGTGFNPEFTGIENIYFNGTIMGFTKEEMDAKVDDIINFADIGDFINQPVKMYSSGMFARLAFSVAINVDPDILIIDEALAVGDAFFQNKCYRKFEDLKKAEKTILFVSHDLYSIRQICSKALWIQNGEQKMFGDRTEVSNSYYSNMIINNNIEIYNNNLTCIENNNYEVNMFEINKYPKIKMSKENIVSPDVEIISCFIMNEKLDITTDLIVDKEYTLSIIFNSKVNINKCIAGFVMQNTKGIWILNCNTLISGEKKNFIVNKDTLNRVDFTFMLPKLIKGEYVIDIALAEGVMSEHKALVWLYNALSVKIINSGINSSILEIETKVKVSRRENNS